MADDGEGRTERARKCNELSMFSFFISLSLSLSVSALRHDSNGTEPVHRFVRNSDSKAPAPGGLSPFFLNGSGEMITSVSITTIRVSLGKGANKQCI